MKSDSHSTWPPPGLSSNAVGLAQALVIEGPSTRRRLSELTGHSRPTVTMALEELKDNGLLMADTASSAEEHAIGRRAKLVRLSRRAGLVMGIEVGRRHIQVVLADLGHQLIDMAPAETDSYHHR